MVFNLSSTGPQFTLNTTPLGQQTAQDIETFTKRILSSFANQLEEYQLSKGQSNEIDVFELIQSYVSLAAEFKLSTHPVTETEEEGDSWALEVKLWNLLKLILGYRQQSQDFDFAQQQQKPAIPEYCSNILHSEKIFQEDTQLFEISLLMNWITENSLAVEKPTSLTTNAKWLQTLLYNQLDSYDSDCPARTGQTIHPNDREQDDLFFRYIFKLLVTGKYDQALDECATSNQWSLRLIMIGRNEFFDPVLDCTEDDQMEHDGNTTTSGIKKRSLWRRATYLLSRDETLLASERAIYAFLSGTIDDALPFAETYDEELMVYLNATFNSAVESKLIAMGKIPSEELISAIPNSKLDIQQILNTIDKSKPEQAEDPLRILMGSIITNNVSEIINSFLTHIGSLAEDQLTGADGEDDEDEIIDNTTTLRILTHLTIVLTEISSDLLPEQSKTQLITVYTLILRKFQLFSLIPVYIAQLPVIPARDVYSLFLSDMLDSEERTKQLRLARLYGLPLEDILNRTVSLVFDKSESYYNTATGKAIVIQVPEHEADEVDFRLIRAVEWFIEEKMYTDSLRAVLTLARRFLTNGKVVSWSLFLDRNDLSDLIKQYEIDNLAVSQDEVLINEQEINELVQYEKLSQLLQSSISSHELDIEPFTNSFLTTNESDLFLELRTLYIPHLVITYHNALVNSKDYRTAMQLVNLVASEKSQLYVLFKNAGRLTEYLAYIAQCAALQGV
ncbi:hypothetical protein WICPIJ_010025 [Wickerhamomyces pijperi]|uniref:Nuclear pore complex protein n=1 Tax=Wickerhamomyces pijperi TaxID=599730 RepID=A0A9P8PJG6_WICPI|nr:hypothetical protein WICPIJ_010025 [Wickerhamomyces pijperi]